VCVIGSCDEHITAVITAVCRTGLAVGHWRTQGGAASPPMAGQKRIFFVKIEGLSSLPPAKSGRACYDNGKGVFLSDAQHVYLCKGKVFPYSLPSVGPGADPGVQAVSPQVT